MKDQIAGPLKSLVKGQLKGILRRQRDIYFPTAETRHYRAWIKRRHQERKARYNRPLQPGLLSILTAVWDGSPVRYLQELADSISAQNTAGHCEWVIVDNGCSKSDLSELFNDLKKDKWVRVCRVERNIGILRGLRLALENASGRYILPVDADDLLYPDALQIVTASIEDSGYPPLLYTDEDKVAPGGVSQPYFKGDWDPVLLANSAYIAHLGVVDRAMALDLGAYTNNEAEGSPDWDLFAKFTIAGYHAFHIPEVVYSWRIHSQSTADDAASKTYIARSQKAVLSQFLEPGKPISHFSLEESPLLPGGAHWRFRRQQVNPKPLAIVLLRGTAPESSHRKKIAAYPEASVSHFSVSASPRDLASVAQRAAQKDGFVCLLDDDLRIEWNDWPWEAIGIFERFPDTVMVGGQIWDGSDIVLDAGQYFGFAGPCGSPNRGRLRTDPGYFGQMWKQRSVSAVSTQCAVVRANFLADSLPGLPLQASIPCLGAWLGARAFREGARVVYTPYIGGELKGNRSAFLTEPERESFLRINSDLIPDHRFYPAVLSLEHGYQLR